MDLSKMEHVHVDLFTEHIARNDPFSYECAVLVTTAGKKLAVVVDVSNGAYNFATTANRMLYAQKTNVYWPTSVNVPYWDFLNNPLEYLCTDGTQTCTYLLLNRIGAPRYGAIPLLPEPKERP